MKRVIAVLALVLVSCAQRTKSIDLHTSVNFSLAVAEMEDVGDKIGGITSPKTAKNSLESETVGMSPSADEGGVSEKTNPEGENSPSQSPKKSDREIISESVFYVFDQNGVFQSKSMFSGSDNFDVDIKHNGRHTVYVLCNLSEIVDLPASPSKEQLESLTVSHVNSYTHLPFAGKTEVEIIPGSAQQIKVKLNRINSAIRLENGSADRIDLDKMTVSGLPSMGYVFTPGEAVQGVTYNETAEAQTDADGNAVVYSFMVPKAQIADVKLEAKAKLKDAVDINDPNTDNIATVAPLSFLGSLEAGKRATALIGYLENGTLRVGSPENWGNVGKYQLTDDVLLQVIGGTFNDKGELRAYSGGCEFSFIIVSKSGEASLEPVNTIDWIHINDNVIVVDPNTTDSERKCRIAVKVGGGQVGIFIITQGPCLSFKGVGDTEIEDGKVIVIGGKSTSSQVTFSISDDEFDDLDIVAAGNGQNGIDVTINRTDKTISATFNHIVDASEVPEEGVSVPVNFVDLNGGVQACVTFVQRPARIILNPNNLTMTNGGESKLSVVTTEGEAVWVVNSVKDASGNAISWLTATTTSSPAASGNNLRVTAQANTATTTRTAYVRVESRATISKPLEVEQEASVVTEVLEIDGVTWTKYNLANPKQAPGGATFATKLPSECTGVRAESHGKFYQWGINVAWSTTDPLSSTPSGATWNKTNYQIYNWNDDPCPDGYRLPTTHEMAKLHNNSSHDWYGGRNSSDYGYVVYRLNGDSSEKLEFPAAGYIRTSGLLSNAGEYLNLWTSTHSHSNVAYGYESMFGIYSPMYATVTYQGFNVRCVKGDIKQVVDEIEMSGLKWAKYNLANPKQASGGATFATKLPSQCSGTRAESHGKFYQWGINVAWNSTGALGGATPSGSWQTSTSYPSNWNTQPCPDGYRLPTIAEFQNLTDNCTRTIGGGWTSSDYGYITLTLRTDSSKKLEFPAVGYRGTSGTLNTAGQYGRYWSSVAYDSNSAYGLSFHSSNVSPQNRWDKRYGLSVRCVRQ